MCGKSNEGERGSGKRIKNDGDESAARFTALLLYSSRSAVIPTICRWNRGVLVSPGRAGPW